jgi:hypothetical protein
VSEQKTTEASGPDPAREVGPEAAAQILGIPVTRVLELVAVGAVPARLEDATPMLRVADLEAYREERARRRPAMREINQIVNETPTGWDA